MTFDEALKELDDDTRVTDEDGIEYTVGLDFGTVESVVEELRETYAQTVEMTQLQVDQMMSFKAANVGFGTFIYKQGLGEVPAFKDWIQQDREDELMQAWLHPETIKVVDDERS